MIIMQGRTFINLSSDEIKMNVISLNGGLGKMCEEKTANNVSL